MAISNNCNLFAFNDKGTVWTNGTAADCNVNEALWYVDELSITPSLEIVYFSAPGLKTAPNQVVCGRMASGTIGCDWQYRGGMLMALRQFFQADNYTNVPAVLPATVDHRAARFRPPGRLQQPG